MGTTRGLCIVSRHTRCSQITFLADRSSQYTYYTCKTDGDENDNFAHYENERKKQVERLIASWRPAPNSKKEMLEWGTYKNEVRTTETSGPVLLYDSPGPQISGACQDASVPVRVYIASIFDMLWRWPGDPQSPENLKRTFAIVSKSGPVRLGEGRSPPTHLSNTLAKVVVNAETALTRATPLGR